MSKIATGDLIRAARKKRDLSVAELADKVGVTRQAAALWEAGAEPTVKNLQAIAEALDVPLISLLVKP